MTALPTNAGTQHANAYLRTRVMSASPEELRLMLLDGAIKFATQGKEGLERKDYEASYNGISQCRNIVFELLTTIREGLAPELTSNVKALYTFLYTHLLDASVEKSPAKVEEVIELLQYERETWVLLMDRIAAEKAAGTFPENLRAAQAAAAPADRAPLFMQG
jgi:flagellar secretion chaperone FliS